MRGTLVFRFSGFGLLTGIGVHSRIVGTTGFLVSGTAVLLRGLGCGLLLSGCLLL